MKIKTEENQLQNQTPPKYRQNLSCRSCIFLISLLFLLPFCGHAQQLEWVRTVESDVAGFGKAIVVDDNNNVFLAGAFWGRADFDNSEDSLIITSNGLSDCFVSKYNENGTLLWAFGFGGDWPDKIFSLVTDGEYIYIGGIISGDTIDFDPSPDTFNIISNQSREGFIAKYDIDGNFIWAKKVGCTSHSDIFSIALNNNTILATGSFSYDLIIDDPNFTDTIHAYENQDLMLLCFDLDGNYQWGFHLGENTDNGNTFLCEGKGLATDESGNIYMTGVIQGPVDFDPSENEFMVYGGYYYDLFLAKYSQDGNLIWAFAFGGPSNDYSREIVYNNNQLLLTGSFSEIVDFDPSTNQYNVIGGYWGSTFIAKYSTAGEIIWAYGYYSSSNPNVGMSVSFDESLNVLVGGWSSDTIDLNPNAEEFILNPMGTNGFIASYNSDNNLNWGFLLGTHTDEIYDVYAKNNAIYITGYFGYECNFDFLGGETILYSGNYSGTAFIAKYDNITKISEKEDYLEFLVFPNPAIDIVNINCEGVKNVSLFSLYGTQLLKIEIEKGEKRKILDLSFLEAGIYLIEAEYSKGNRISKKIIKL